MSIRNAFLILVTLSILVAGQTGNSGAQDSITPAVTPSKAASDASKTENRMMGTWEQEGLKTRRQIKMYTDTHFVWISYDLATGKPTGCGGGTYTLSDSTLTETLEYCTAERLIGKSIPLTVEFFDRDRWRQFSDEQNVRASTDETYHRVKPAENDSKNPNG